jgi:hypothetical protein
MAKRRRNVSRDVQHPRTDDGRTQPTPGAEVTLGRTEAKIVDFAEDLGRLLGTAQRKASEWMGQRQAVVQQLQEIRSTADELLSQLTERARAAAGLGGRGRGRGRPSAEASPAQPARRGRPPGRKKRTMSAEARERIAAAQRKRWAKVKRERAKA